MRTRLSRKLSLMSCKGGSSTEADKLTLLLTTLSAKLEAIVMAVKDDQQIQIYFVEELIPRSQVLAKLSRAVEALEEFKRMLIDYGKEAASQRLKECAQQRINIKILQKVLLYFPGWLDRNRLYDSAHPLPPITRVTRLFDLECKLDIFLQFLPTAVAYKDDIASFEIFTSKTYQFVYRNFHVSTLGDNCDMDAIYHRMKTLMTITNAAVITELKREWAITRIFVFGLSFPRFFLDFKEAEYRCQLLYRRPDVEKVKKIWNLPEQGAISRLKFITYPSIALNESLWIPLSPPKQGQVVDIHNPSTDSISIHCRLLHYQALQFKTKQAGCSSCCLPNHFKVINTLIIHAHGGGFIALSSATMQNYTRRWANSLKTAVLSVDYRKPPSHLFPAAVDDMLAIYRFVTEHFFTYTNIRPSKIILAGDSAGGNLMCSLVGLILKHKLPRPQGLFLAYPACDARKRFSPSRINSFEDPILYPTLLLMCLEEYLGYNQLTQYNPLASPLLLTEAFVGGAADDQRFPIAWPKTIVVIGKKDPLYDDSLRLCERMASSNVNFHCEIYRNLSHGFLSVDQLVPQSKQAIEDSIGFIRDLID